MREWKQNRELVISRLEHIITGRGFDPLLLMKDPRTVAKTLESKQPLTRREKLLLGIWMFAWQDRQAEEEYLAAVGAGARPVVIPQEIGEYGKYTINCCIGDSDEPFSRDQTIELTLFEHQVWTCPRCGKVWALRNMAAVDTEEDDV